MRTLLAASAVFTLAIAGCGPNKGGNGNGIDAQGNGIIDGTPDACVGLECMKVDCTGQGIGTTRLSGTVYAPNGTLPLYNVSVYVPNAPVGALQDGVSCDRCNDALPGNPTSLTTTDELGHFQLDNVPVVANLPLVVTIGKWRRQYTIPTVTMCADNPLPADKIRLPKNQQEGDMPQIGISTGECDAIECLVHKLGIDDKEFTNSSGTGRVHLYQGYLGSGQFATGFVNQGTFAPSTGWWSDLNQLKKYDILLFGCECSEHPEEKGPQALQAVYDYANLGGRIFMSHYHNYWVYTAPQPWPAIANFDLPDNGDVPDSATDTINQSFPKGISMYKWLDGPEVMGLDANKKLDVTDPRDTVKSINNYPGTTMPRADDFVDLGGCSGGCSLSQSVQDFQFTVPNDKPDADRCGKVVFSDMHVSATSSPGSDFPSGCDTNPLTPQEKALAFIFFDISSCVGPVVN